MRQEKTNLTSDQVRDSAIESAIPLYLRSGETKESLLKEHGALVKVIQFLRSREFAQYEKSAPKKKPEVPEDSILHPKHDPVYTEPAKTKIKKGKAVKPKSNQSDLF